MFAKPPASPLSVPPDLTLNTVGMKVQLSKNTGVWWKFSSKDEFNQFRKRIKYVYIRKCLPREVLQKHFHLKSIIIFKISVPNNIICLVKVQIFLEGHNDLKKKILPSFDVTKFFFKGDFFRFCVLLTISELLFNCEFRGISALRFNWIYDFLCCNRTYIGNTFREKAVALPFLEICREDLCLNICFWIFSCPPLSSLTFIFILGFRAVIFSNGMALILNVQRW